MNLTYKTKTKPLVNAYRINITSTLKNWKPKTKVSFITDWWTTCTHLLVNVYLNQQCTLYIMRHISSNCNLKHVKIRYQRNIPTNE